MRRNRIERDNNISLFNNLELIELGIKEWIMNWDWNEIKELIENIYIMDLIE